MDVRKESFARARLRALWGVDSDQVREYDAAVKAARTADDRCAACGTERSEHDDTNACRFREAPYLTVVVKGRPSGILAALTHVEHDALIGAELVSMLENETVFRTAYDKLEQVQRWFNETPNMLPGYGFPDGTCLIFSIHDENGAH